MRIVAAALAAGLLALTAAAVPPPVVSWQEASAHVGEVITVAGDVVSATTTGDTVTLEFAADPRAFRVVLLIPLMSDLPPHPERLYAGKRVQASGRIERFKGRSEMVLRSPGQIEVVDVAGVASAAPPAAPPAAATPEPPARPTPPPAAVAPPAPVIERAAPAPVVTTAGPPPAPPTIAPAPPVPAPAAVPPPAPLAAAPPSPPSPAPSAVTPPASPSPEAVPPAAPEPRGLVEAVQRQLPTLDSCERARARWREAGATAREGADALIRCLDGGTYDCRAEAAALAPALSSLEGAAQRVERACP